MLVALCKETAGDALCDAVQSALTKRRSLRATCARLQDASLETRLRSRLFILIAKPSRLPLRVLTCFCGGTRVVGSLRPR